MLKEEYYTVASTITNLPPNETFIICKDVCNKLKETKVKEIDENSLLIKGKSKASIHSFGEEFFLIVTKIDNGSNITIYYNMLGIGGGPAKKDLIEPIFKELSKKIQLTDTKFEKKLLHEYFLANLSSNTQMEKIDSQHHCTMCSKKAALYYLHSSCFVILVLLKNTAKNS